MIRVLGIETSCDETAASVVALEGDAAPKILSNIVLSQIEEHAAFGGVVPEIAARAHVEALDGIVEAALADSGTALADIDAIAATAGPGLVGGLIVGLMTAKAIAAAAGKPLIAVNHLEGHALTARLTDGLEVPYLLLLVSGGHTQILAVRGVGDYQRWATTIDDALGEAFDKTAKMLGLGYPGGPAVEQLARAGNERAHTFPVPMKGREGCDFSFSGLKTAVRLKIQEIGNLNEQQKADICASFQYTAGESICDRTRHAMQMFKSACPQSTHFVLAGGVAANQYLRGRLEKVAAESGMQLVAPPIKLCTDNAAMIAWAGAVRLSRGMVDDLSAPARARWPLDPDAPLALGAGVKA